MGVGVGIAKDLACDGGRDCPRMKRKQQKHRGNKQNPNPRFIKCLLGAGHAQCLENEGP
jgi:hypothetical protein